MQRHSCRPGVHEGTRPVVVELPVTDDRQGLLGERRRPPSSRRVRSATMPRSARRMESDGRLPSRLAASAARANKASARSRSPSSEVGERLGVEHRRSIRTLRGEAVPRRIWESRRIASTPSRHSRARRYASVPSIVLPSDSVPVADVRSAAAAQRSVLAGRPGQGVHQRPVHGDRREAFEQAIGLEPLHPAHHGGAPPTRPDRVGQLQHEAGDPICIAGLLGVLDGGLRLAVRLAPRGRPQVQLSDVGGFAPPQLRQQQLTEQRGDSGTTRDDGRAARPTGCGSPVVRARCSIAFHRSLRRTADRTSGRGSTCG